MAGEDTVEIVALIAAAGRGIRMGGEVEKQFMLLGKKPLLVHALEHFQELSEVNQVIVSAPEERVEYCEREIVGRFGLSKVVAIVPGGEVRQESIYRALGRVSPTADLVVTHDAARPFLFEDVLARTIATARTCGAAVAAIPESDTVKEVNPDGAILRTVDRRLLWRAQTPQAFAWEVLQEAFSRARADGYVATDEAELVERAGYEVRVVPGSRWNIKVTTPEDMELAKLLLAWVAKGSDRRPGLD